MLHICYAKRERVNNTINNDDRLLFIITLSAKSIKERAQMMIRDDKRSWTIKGGNKTTESIKTADCIG